MGSEDLSRLIIIVLCVALVNAARSSGRLIYVDAAATGANDGSSWADAYTDLQEALVEANESAPAVVRVAQGTYQPATSPAGDFSATFQLHSQTVLEGGYAGGLEASPNVRDVDRYLTVLSGDLAGNDSAADTWDSPSRDDNCLVVVTGSGTDETAKIDGFTITGALWYGMRTCLGNPHVARCRFTDNANAGIYACDCNSVVTECVFKGNGYKSSLGGIFCAYGDLTVTDCAFVDNQGAAIRNDGTLNLLRCSFTANANPFLAVVENWGNLIARQCSFTSNLTTAVDCQPRVTLIDCRFTDNSSNRAGAVNALGVVTLVGCEFIGNVGSGSAVMAAGDVFTVENCLFAGNSSRFGAGAIDASSPTVMRLSNCTFVGNRGRPSAIRRSSPSPPTVAEVSQSIVWDGPAPFTEFTAFPPQIALTYCNVQGGYAGEGNVDIDPLFVDPGYWDTNGTPDDANDDIWVAGDYHLKSQAGHWDRAVETWVFDKMTSPCIDAGDPNAPLDDEPFPNGGYANLGAYGGTTEASRSYFGEPVCETHIAGDINGDCKVDDLDMDILMSHWLMPDIGKPNVPPTVVLTSPEDGAELTAPAPIVLQAQASDPDGVVLRVRYALEYRDETTYARGSTSSEDLTNGWQRQWSWSNVDYDGTYTIWAEAVDDSGATGVSRKIHVTLHPSN